MEFAWEGPPAPWYLKGPEMLKQAAEWGIVVDAKTSYEKVQQLVTARAVVEYEKQHLAAMDAAWQAATTAKPGDQPTTESLAQAEGDALPMAEQDDKAMQTAQAEGDALLESSAVSRTGVLLTAEGPSTEENKETEQTASGAAAPMVGQPVRASLAWDLASPAKTKSVENPAFAGLPPKPRCRHCNSLLSDGRCVEPECGKDQGDADK